ncbi:MAG: two-component system, chemotaxis family, protein-glutamate methylesterase/glutaminase [Candidatus Hydrogenedentes bacterium]|nr:two-component system, chemotaxis family, protein-glutamate methylesterase/glutaminase [Candidatus Hydrogenedentota bacterium]
MESRERRNRISVLVIDSSIECRDFVRKALTDLPDIELAGTAPDANIGMMKLRQFKPDLVILDVRIRDIEPAVFTERVRAEHPDLGVLISSPNDLRSAEKSIDALRCGAFDVFECPNMAVLRGLPDEEVVQTIQRRLLPKIRIFSIVRYSQRVRKTFEPRKEPLSASPVMASSPLPATSQGTGNGKYKIVVVGVSTGGPEALMQLVPRIPRTFPVPVLVTLHMPQMFTAPMAVALDKLSQVTVTEARNGRLAEPGNVYLAPGGKHLQVKRANGLPVLIVGDMNPVKGCKPSVDVLFTSAAKIFTTDAIGVMLTGMGDDGVDGMKLMKQRGATTIAQDENSSLVWGMPGNAVRAGCVDEVLSLDALPARLLQLVGIS